MKTLLLIASILVAGAAHAEWATYENVELHGLARDGSWNEPGPKYRTAMVCDVNGADGFLSVRKCAGTTGCSIKRNLKRLAIVVVDVTKTQKNGTWIRVVDAYRTHTEDGFQYDETISLHVKGWASTKYLCDFAS